MVRFSVSYCAKCDCVIALCTSSYIVYLIVKCRLKEIRSDREERGEILQDEQFKTATFPKEKGEPLNCQRFKS